jgi:acyl transferase domain-containing protein
MCWHTGQESLLLGSMIWSRSFQKMSAQTIPRPDSVTSPRIAFVFNGQGAQYPPMGQGILGSWPCFTASMKRAALCLEECSCFWDLIEELMKAPKESRMEDSRIAQPISTAVQLSLVDALKDLGIIPNAVVGPPATRLPLHIAPKPYLSRVL